MCTKSPTSAEHCALLTGGPARHGSCFANFHSFNSLLSCFSSAFQTAEEGHTVGQADSASCHAEDLCNGIWWSMAAGKTQLKWATFSKHGACCSSLTWKWCRKYKSTFFFCSYFLGNAFQPAVLWGCCTAIMFLLCTTLVAGRVKGDARGWVVTGGEHRAALFLQDSAPLSPHMV